MKVCCDSIPGATIISGIITVLPLRHIQVFPDKEIVLEQGANIVEALVSQEHVNVSS